MAATSAWPSLLLQAMCTDKTTNGKKFLSEFKSLSESKHRRIIKGLAHHKPDGRNRLPQSPAQLAERLGRFRRPLRNDTVRTTRIFSAARVASTSMTTGMMSAACAWTGDWTPGGPRPS